MNQLASATKATTTSRSGLIPASVLRLAKKTPVKKTPPRKKLAKVPAGTIVKIYLDGSQKVVVENGGKEVATFVTSVGTPIRRHLSKKKKPDGYEGKYEYREYSASGPFKKSASKGLQHFVHITGTGYGVHSREQLPTKANKLKKTKYLRANGKWDPSGQGCARLKQKDAESFHKLMKAPIKIRYYQMKKRAKK